MEADAALHEVQKPNFVSVLVLQYVQRWLLSFGVYNQAP